MQRVLQWEQWGKSPRTYLFFFSFLLSPPAPFQFTYQVSSSPTAAAAGKRLPGHFFELNFQTLPSYPFTFYISLLEIGNLNLFSPLGFLFFCSFVLCFIFWFCFSTFSSLYCLSIWCLFLKAAYKSMETNKPRNKPYYIEVGRMLIHFTDFRHRQKSKGTISNTSMNCIP